MSGQNVNCSSKYNVLFTGIFTEKKMQTAFEITFFSKNISVYAICNHQNLNKTLTYDIVSFEKLDPSQNDINLLLT